MMMENKKKWTELEFRDSSICLLCIQTQKHTTDRNQQIGIGVHVIAVYAMFMHLPQKGIVENL